MGREQAPEPEALRSLGGAQAGARRVADDRPVGAELLGRVDEGQHRHRGAALGGGLGDAQGELGAGPGTGAVVDEDDELVEQGRRIVGAFSARGRLRRIENPCEFLQAEPDRVAAVRASGHDCEAPRSQTVEGREGAVREGSAQLLLAAARRSDDEGLEAGKVEERGDGAVEQRMGGRSTEALSCPSRSARSTLPPSRRPRSEGVGYAFQGRLADRRFGRGGAGEKLFIKVSPSLSFQGGRG